METLWILHNYFMKRDCRVEFGNIHGRLGRSGLWCPGTLDTLIYTEKHYVNEQEPGLLAASDNSRKFRSTVRLRDRRQALDRGKDTGYDQIRWFLSGLLE